MINPYALGHMINHPPPDTPANCLLIDFDLPYVFFPSLFTRYIPYINYREEQKTKKTSETRGGDVFRAVAVVSATTLAHGEELYVDYLKDERLAPENLEFVPDWLLEPPTPSPYLLKKEFVAKVPYLVKILHGA